MKYGGTMQIKNETDRYIRAAIRMRPDKKVMVMK